MTRTLFFEITDRCNHACFYCCKSFRGQPGITMNSGALDKVLSLPASGLVISGGEPSLAKESVAYVLERATVPVAINTNLSCWTPEEMDFLNPRVRFNISVPSADERTFRDITGADTFRQVMGNLERADRNSTIIVIVHERNREELAFTVSRLAVRGFRHFGFQPAYGMARSEVELAAKAIERIWAAYPHLDIKGISPWPGSKKTPVPFGHRCNAGNGRLVILSDGRIVPCACGGLPVVGTLDGDAGELFRAGEAFHHSFPLERRELCKGYAEAACC